MSDAEWQRAWEAFSTAERKKRSATALAIGRRLLAEYDRAGLRAATQATMAQLLARLCRFDEAEAFLEQISRVEDPEFEYILWTTRGRVADIKSDPVAAETFFRKACEVRDHTAPRIFLGRALWWQGKFAEAEATYRDAATREGDVDEALENLGNVLRAQERNKEALEAYQSAAALDPENRRIDANIADLEEAMAIASCEAEWDQLWDALWAAKKEKRVATALALGRRLLAEEEREGSQGTVRVAMAELLNRECRFDEAQAYLEQFSKDAGPEDQYFLWRKRGQLALQEGDPVAAEACFRKADELSDDPKARIWVGIALWWQGKLTEAEAVHRDAAASGDDVGGSLRHLGYVLRAQERNPEAVDAFRRAEALDPDNPRITAAIADLEEAIAITRPPTD